VQELGVAGALAFGALERRRECIGDGGELEVVQVPA